MSYWRVWFNGGYFATVLAETSEDAVAEALKARVLLGYIKEPFSQEVLNGNSNDHRKV